MQISIRNLQFNEVLLKCPTDREQNTKTKKWGINCIWYQSSGRIHTQSRWWVLGHYGATSQRQQESCSQSGEVTKTVLKY